MGAPVWTDPAQGHPPFTEGETVTLKPSFDVPVIKEGALVEIDVTTPQISPESEVLRHAATIVRRGWTRGSQARVGRFGNAVDVNNPFAQNFCAVGAINRAALELHQPSSVAKRARKSLRRALGRRSITYWNDSVVYDSEQVANWLRHAAS
jgi:hypothetical protein